MPPTADRYPEGSPAEPPSAAGTVPASAVEPGKWPMYEQPGSE
jgi:hypothetical protein